MAFFFVSDPKPSTFRCFSAVLFSAPPFSLESGAAATSPKKLSRPLNLQERIRLMLWKIPLSCFLGKLLPHNRRHSFFSVVCFVCPVSILF
ncbi:hypothetical protein CEXT_311571 [Caerostris extrusa]|uniref:Uncharacterized protein n=1 Tax=Caerostris extrusa TaxID=172846 RepID=A0AAV4NIQ6_CAEEX|nr:hypothetical protein CEXT_311571 [Caerostris extrusa]